MQLNLQLVAMERCARAFRQSLLIWNSGRHRPFRCIYASTQGTISSRFIALFRVKFKLCMCFLQGAVKDCYMLSVPIENLRLKSKPSEGTNSDGPPIAEHLDISVQDLAQALIQCQAFKFEERVLQTLGLEEKFDINGPAGSYEVDSKVCTTSYPIISTRDFKPFLHWHQCQVKD